MLNNTVHTPDVKVWCEDVNHIICPLTPSWSKGSSRQYILPSVYTENCKMCRQMKLQECLSAHNSKCWEMLPPRKTTSILRNIHLDMSDAWSQGQKNHSLTRKPRWMERWGLYYQSGDKETYIITRAKPLDSTPQSLYLPCAPLFCSTIHVASYPTGSVSEV